MYRLKIALIVAKRAVDSIGYLDEETYQAMLWDHEPLTDFWHIGVGSARRLARYGITTMGQITQTDEDLLYRLFGIDAELLIDHAWGREPVTIADIKAYVPESKCITSGQVLKRDYSFEEGKLIVRERLDLMCLDLVDKGLVTSSVTIHIGYSNALKAEPARGTASLGQETNVDSRIIPAVLETYGRIVDTKRYIRRLNISFNNVQPQANTLRQGSLFDSELDHKKMKRYYKRQQAIIDIKARFGKNAILKGINLKQEATTRERNRQLGGHRSGE
ncbi:MAG TPA: hypothetical protein VJ036_00730 [bacterium]|nr:hypothetical protein [bacterium]